MFADRMPIAAKTLHDSRRSLGFWALALVVIVAANVPVFSSYEDTDVLAAQAEALPESLRESLGMDQITTATGYIQSTIFGMNALVLLLIFAIGFGARCLAGEEETGTLDLLLAHPVSRRRLVVERVVALAASATFLSATVGVSVWAFSAALGLDVQASGIAAASLALSLLATASGTLAVAIGGAVGRRSVVLATTAGAVVLAYLVRAVAPQVTALNGLERLSPIDWYLGADPVANGADLVVLTLLAALTLACAVAAAVLFERRDIRT